MATVFARPMQTRVPAMDRPTAAIPETLYSLCLQNNGLPLSKRLTFDKWISIGKQLSLISSASAWCLGDWLVYGQSAYVGRYRAAIEQTSLDYQTLRNYAWVARKFQLSRRREKLSFGHHAEVAALPEPEQDFWLSKAEYLLWSRNRLRNEIRASLKERSQPASKEQSRHHNEERIAGGNPDPRPDYAGQGYTGPDQSIEIKLLPEQMQLCRAAADHVGLSLETWAALVLEKIVLQGLHVPQDNEAASGRRQSSGVSAADLIPRDKLLMPRPLAGNSVAQAACRQPEPRNS